MSGDTEKREDIIINKLFINSFRAGQMRLELTGTCTSADLEDAEKVLLFAIAQLQRLRKEEFNG